MSTTEVKIDGKWRKLGEKIKYGHFWWIVAAIHHDGKIELSRKRRERSMVFRSWPGHQEITKTIFED
jgi:hypothetical protein